MNQRTLFFFIIDIGFVTKEELKLFFLSKINKNLTKKRDKYNKNTGFFPYLLFSS